MSDDNQQPKYFWFSEETLPSADQDVRISIKAAPVYDTKSQYNHIQILDTPKLGKILVLDGIVSIAQNTEFIYHEMMVTLPCIRHGNPKSILIIGGGDGGAAKHALRIKTIQRVAQVEIDKTIADICKEYIPEISGGSLKDDRVELIIDDGQDFIKKTHEKFDVVVLDITESVSWGPDSLLTEEFIAGVEKILKSDGVVSIYGGVVVLQPEKIGATAQMMRKKFSNVEMHLALVPEYEFTESSFFVCGPQDEMSLEEVNRRFKALLTQECKYLSPDVYLASAVLSPYIKKLTGLTQ